MLGATVELDSELLFLLAVLEHELNAVSSSDLVIKPPSHMLEFALLVHDQATGAVTWKALQRQTVEVVGPETGVGFDVRDGGNGHGAMVDGGQDDDTTVGDPGVFLDRWALGVEQVRDFINVSERPGSPESPQLGLENWVWGNGSRKALFGNI